MPSLHSLSSVPELPVSHCKYVVLNLPFFLWCFSEIHFSLCQICLFWNTLLLCVHLTRSWISSVPTDLPYPSPTSHLSPHSPTPQVLCWQFRFRTPLFLGCTTYINNHFLVTSDVEIDLMSVNQFSIHLVSVGLVVCGLLSKRFYGNKADAFEKCKYVMVSLSPS